MSLGRFSLLPDGSQFPVAARDGLKGPIDRSQLAIATARAAAGLGLVAAFNPFYYVGNTVADGMAGRWDLEGGEQFGASGSAINGQPAVTFVHGNTRRFVSSFTRPAGSFGVVMVLATAPSEAAVFPSLPFSTGDVAAGTSNLCHARYQDGTLHFLANNNDANGRIDTTIGSGGFALAFSYDAAAGTGAVIQADGTVQQAAFAAPPSGFPWRVGGFGDGFGFSGKIGQVLIFNAALHTGQLAATTALLTALKSGYGL